MFSLFKKRKPHEAEARALYGAVMEVSRDAAFYERLGVPDSMDGRFDLLLVHMFLIIDRLLGGRAESDVLAQALFDVAFADVDQALREDGVGDMKISKHMKRMMLAFNGRMHVYDAAMNAPDDAALKAALRRNLYGTSETVQEEHLGVIAQYMRAGREALAAQDEAQIRGGKPVFPAIAQCLDGQTQEMKEVRYG